MPSTPNSEIVCRAFSLMELGQGVSNAQYSDKKLMELRQKVPSSFVGGQWLSKSLIKTEPWIQFEAKPMEKSYWMNADVNKIWQNLSYCERAQFIEKIAGVFETEGPVLAEVESSLHKVSSQKFSSETLPFLVNYIRYYAGWAGLKYPDNKPLKPQGCFIVDVRKSVFPLVHAVWAIAPALAAGNTVNVLATQRAESLLHLASASVKAGLLSGIFNVILSDEPDTSKILKSSPSVTFSPFQSAKNMEAESFIQNPNNLFSLHGRCHMLVLRHADYEAAVETLLDETAHKHNLSVWPVTEVLVEEHLFDGFVKHLKTYGTRIDASTMPASQWTNTDLNVVKLHAAQEQLEVCIIQNAVFLLGGRMPEPSNTWEAESETRKLAVSLLPVRSHAEALSIVSSRPRTVAASVWTEDGNLAMQVATSLKLSMVWINQHGTLPNPGSRFGSWNCAGGSQFGGKEALFGFLQCSGNQADSCVLVKSSAVGQGEYPSVMQLGLYYGGEVRKGTQGDFKLLDTHSKPFAVTSVAAQKDADAAVAAGFKAAAGWASKGTSGRAAVLKSLADVLMKQRSSYESILSSVGNDKVKASDDLQVAKNAIYQWIYMADKITGDMIGDGKPSSTCMVTRQPLGVVAICGSASASLGELMNVIAPALILGNTVVLGAASTNPIPALLLAQTLLTHASVPAGVLNILSWGVETTLAAHPDVAALWVGETTLPLISGTFKRVWHIPNDFASETCPVEWFIHQATKCKTIYL